MSVELISVLIAVLAIGATLAGPVGPLAVINLFRNVPACRS